MPYATPAVNDPAPEAPIESGTMQLSCSAVFQSLTSKHGSFSGSSKTYHTVLMTVGEVVPVELSFSVPEAMARRLLPHVGADVVVNLLLPCDPEKTEGDRDTL